MPADAALLPHWLGAAVIALLAPLVDAGAGRARALRAAAGADAGAGLVHHLPPRAHRGRAAGAVRLRRRGRPGGLRARDRRRRAAGADRHAGPAAARPRDHARAGAAGRRRRCSCTALAAAPFRPLAPRVAVLLSRCRCWPAAARRRWRWPSALGGAAGLRALDATPQVRALAPLGRRRHAGRARAGAAARRLALARRRRSTPATLLRHRAPVGLVPVAGLAAGAVDAVALAPPPAAPPHLGAAGRAWPWRWPPTWRWAAPTAR
ncbi:MAG: hypothetical protein MZW92_25950 [Comamonadaceae bacterium]|nr:hypothetical protein [Comamonadaceae bacterium]